MQVPVSLAEYM